MKQIACHDSAVASESAVDLQAASRVPDFFDALFSLLNDGAVQYCVLSPSAQVAADGSEVLELAVHPRHRRELARLFYGLPRERFRPVQCISAATLGTDQFHFALLGGPQPLLVRVDIQYPGKCALLSAVEDEFFARKQWQSKRWMAAPADRFSYLLAKAGQLRALTGPEEESLKLSVETLGRAEAEKIAGRLFGFEIQTEVVEACSSLSFSSTLPQLRNLDWRNTVPQRISRCLLGVVSNTWWLLRNWFCPNGLLITILGPDGAGKTTLSTMIFDVFGPAFGPRKILLWRPEVLPRLSRTDSAMDLPHSKPNRGGLESVLRILAIFLDYWVGHFMLVKPLLSRSGLIVYDRDLHDVLVDSRRYRYGGPNWLPRLLIKALPQTESLFLILDAPLEVILARKQEVPPEEVSRQLAAYRKLATDLSNSYLVHTDGDLEATTSAVAQSVVDYLGRRYVGRHNPKQAVDSSSVATNPLTSRTETIRGAVAGFFSQSQSWLQKGFLAVVDQGLVSGSNFVLAILLARWLPAEQYGAYALSFAIFLLLSLIQQGLFLEPMSVFGPSVYRNSQREYLGALLVFQGALAAVSIALAAAAAATRLGDGQLAPLGMLFSAPCVLLYWFARRAFYLQLQPGRAVAGAIVYCALLATGFYFLVRTGLLSAFTAFLSIGAAALITSVRQLFQLRPILTGKKRSELWRVVGNDHWRYGRWAILSFLFIWIPWNIYYPVVGHFSGLAEVAALRALLNLALPVTQALSAFTLLFLPHASQVSLQESWAGAQRLALKITAFFALGGAVYWLPVCLFRTSLLQLLYGGHYSGIARLVPWIALSSFLSGLALGPSMAFRAMRSPSTVTFVYFISSGIALLFGIPATHFFGIAGAVTCSLLSSAAAAVLGWTMLARQPRPETRPGLVEQEAVL